MQSSKIADTGVQSLTLVTGVQQLDLAGCRMLTGPVLQPSSMLVPRAGIILTPRPEPANSEHVSIVMINVSYIDIKYWPS